MEYPYKKIRCIVYLDSVTFTKRQLFIAALRIRAHCSRIVIKECDEIAASLRLRMALVRVPGPDLWPTWPTDCTGRTSARVLCVAWLTLLLATHEECRSSRQHNFINKK